MFANIALLWRPSWIGFTVHRKLVVCAHPTTTLASAFFLLQYWSEFCFIVMIEDADTTGPYNNGDLIPPADPSAPAFLSPRPTTDQTIFCWITSKFSRPAVHVRQTWEWGFGKTTLLSKWTLMWYCIECTYKRQMMKHCTGQQRQTKVHNLHIFFINKAYNTWSGSWH